MSDQEDRRVKRRQVEALAKQRENGRRLREWLEERGRLMREAYREKPVEPTCHGVTRLMRNIPKVRPEVLVRGSTYRRPPEEVVDNPKASRRLRKELR